MKKPFNSNDMLDSLFPIGKERWVKVKYLDQEKSHKNFRLINSTPEMDLERGYEVKALSGLDEYEPQVAALFEIKSNIISTLYGKVDEFVLENISAIITNKMDELKEMATQKVEDL